MIIIHEQEVICHPVISACRHDLAKDVMLLVIGFIAKVRAWDMDAAY
jgi:hypothetical protein